MKVLGESNPLSSLGVRPKFRPPPPMYLGGIARPDYPFTSQEFAQITHLICNDLKFMLSQTISEQSHKTPISVNDTSGFSQAWVNPQAFPHLGDASLLLLKGQD